MIAMKETERFCNKVEIDRDSDCWNWTGGKTSEGYGLFWARSQRLVCAHRAIYEWIVGEIAEGLEIDHLCRNTSCVNPDHLEAVTHLVNVRRSWAHRRAVAA